MRRLIVGAAALCLLTIATVGTLRASHLPFASTDAAFMAAITVPGTVPGYVVLGRYVSG